MTVGNHKMFSDSVVTGMEYVRTRKQKANEDSEDYMDYLGT